MIKIIHVLEEGRYGGPQKRTVDISREFRDYDIESILIIPKRKNERLVRNIEAQNLKYFSIELMALGRSWKQILAYMLFFFPDFFRLYRILKKERPDIVQCNGAWQIKGMIVSKLVGIKNVWYLNDTNMPAIVLLLFKFISKLFAYRFIAASERTKSFYTMDSKIQVIPSGVNVSFYSPSEIKGSLKKYEGIKVVTVANINPIKGIEVFMKMAHELNLIYDGKTKINFLIVGSKLASQQKYFEMLTQLLKNLRLQNMYLLGHRDDVKDILNESDIYVCSSHHEASPNSVWEAMAMGNAVVSTDVGDVKSFFKSNSSGLVVPTNSPKKMAHAVNQLIQNPTQRETYGRNARLAVEESLDIKKCARKYVEFYSKILNKNLISKYVHSRY